MIKVNCVVKEVNDGNKTLDVLSTDEWNVVAICLNGTIIQVYVDDIQAAIENCAQTGTRRRVSSTRRSF